MAADLVDKLLCDVHPAHDFDAFVDAFANESSPDVICGASHAGEERYADAEGDDEAPEEGTLTQQAQKLRQDTLRRQLDELTPVWPILQGEPRRKETEEAVSRRANT